jgi:hypothetical protein
VLVLGAAVAAAIYGWSATTASRAEFWTVAIPGLATGAGTLALALSTVWTSRSARIDRELERLAAEDRYVFREAYKVVAILQHRSTGAVYSIANAGREPILDVVAYVPKTAPDEHGISYEWQAKSPEHDWPGSWFIEHSLRALFVQADAQFSIEGNIYRVDRDGGCTAGQLGDGKRLESELHIAWTDSTGLRWLRVAHRDPEIIGFQHAGQAW